MITSSEGNEMSYRKISVNGKVYEYSIGRTHTKIKGLGAFKNEEVGQVQTYVMYNDITDEFETHKDGVIVRPSDVAYMIKGLQY
jgi:hypothetical protein